MIMNVGWNQFGIVTSFLFYQWVHSPFAAELSGVRASSLAAAKSVPYSYRFSRALVGHRALQKIVQPTRVKRQFPEKTHARARRSER